MRRFVENTKEMLWQLFRLHPSPRQLKKNIRSNLTERHQYRTPTVTMRVQPEEFPNLKTPVNTRASDDVRLWLQEVFVKCTIPGSVSLSPPLSVSLCVRAQVGVS